MIFWLDPDQPGRAAMYKLFKKLEYQGGKNTTRLMFMGTEIGQVPGYAFKKVDFNNVPKDPKLYLDHEIRHIITNLVVDI